MKNANSVIHHINHKPKVIFIQPGYAHYRKELFKRMVQNYNILFIFMTSSSKYPSSDQADKKWKSIFLNSEKNFFFLLKLIKILLTEKYDVVISSISGSYQSIISYFIARLRTKPYILWNIRWCTEYKYDDRRYLHKVLRSKLAQYVIKRTDSVVVGGSTSHNYHKNLGVSNSRIYIANQSVEIINRKIIRTNLKKDLGIKKKYVILYLSRVINWKGLDILICAFKKLESIRNDVFLLSCGAGEFLGYCKDLAKNLKVQNIKFAGAIEHEYVYDYFNIADVFILPSCMRQKAEAWGLVINEAMIAGKPIITTNAVGAAEDLVINGINGYVVKNNDIDEMYTALKNFFKGGDQLIETMGKNSKLIISQFNDYDKMFGGFKNAIDYSIKNFQVIKNKLII